MNSRMIIKALALGLALSAMACTQRTIIQRSGGPDDGTNDGPAATQASDDQSGVNNVLYVRSGSSEPGEEQSGPFPEPWEERAGPFPEPWHHEANHGGSGGSGSGNGSSDPPSSNPDDPDPNPKP